MFRSFDRHTLLDLTVNAVPFCILLTFGFVFFVYNPWGRLGLAGFWQYFLLLVPAVFLAVVTYQGGVLMSRSAHDRSSGEGAAESDYEELREGEDSA